MNILVLLKMVPDVVEELEVAGDGKSLDTEVLRMILSEPSDHALEQALLLKEKHGGKITVATLDAPEVDDALFTALAKGADRAVKIAAEPAVSGTVSAAKLFASWLLATGGQISPDTLVLTGSYAIDDWDGELAPALAEILRLPFVGVVTGLTLDEGAKKVVLMKEFFGGLRGEYELPLPAILGIQAAEKPPRYVPVAKVRAVMKSARIETLEVPAPEVAAGAVIEKMYKPEVPGRAEMWEGTPEEISKRLVGLLVERGLI